MSVLQLIRPFCEALAVLLRLHSDPSRTSSQRLSSDEDSVEMAHVPELRLYVSVRLCVLYEYAGTMWV